MPQTILTHITYAAAGVAATSDASPNTMRSVTELLSLAHQGDAAAWEEIVHRYGRLVWSKVRSFRLQDADAFDAMQMTWLRLAENSHRLRHPERLAGWLAKTACRECLHILRQTRRTAEPPDVALENLVDPAADPEKQVIDVDTAQALRGLLNQLPPREQTLLRALFADGPQPYTEIARSTGIPIGSIGPTRARALQRLRGMLEEHGLGRAV